MRKRRSRSWRDASPARAGGPFLQRRPCTGANYLQPNRMSPAPIPNSVEALRAAQEGGTSENTTIKAGRSKTLAAQEFLASSGITLKVQPIFARIPNRTKRS